MTPPEIRCEMQGDAAVASVIGEFDISSADELRRVITTGCAEASGLVLDLTETVYLDSSAIRTLLSLSRMFQTRGGAVAAVVPARGLVRKVVLVSGFDAVMPVVETRDEALKFAAGPQS